MRTLLIDNYDSFTFNLFQALAVVNGLDPLVMRNDQVTVADIRGMDVDNVVISPGPGHPARAADVGVCAAALRELADLPILGVCLGCQGLGLMEGAAVVPAPEPVHGRTSAIWHDDADLFHGIPQGFLAVRYHSLMVAPPLPPTLRRIAWTDDGIIMGLRHASRPIWGVQFHPESIGTEHGLAILKNFHAATARRHSAARARQPEIRATPASVVPHGLHVESRRTCDPLHWKRLPLNTTAEAVFCSLLADEPYAYWLDSSLVRAGLSRFSFMGAVAAADTWQYNVTRKTITTAAGAVVATNIENVFTALRERLNVAPCEPQAELPFDFQGGVVGYWGYELKADAAVGVRGPHPSAEPDATLFWSDRFLAFDHEAAELFVVARQRADGAVDADAWIENICASLARVVPVAPPPTRTGAPASPNITMSRTPARYTQDICQCLESIGAGESYEICLTQNVHADVTVNPLDLHRTLRLMNPAPYAAYLRAGDLAVVSSSPERFLRVDRARVVESKPIKGTQARGATPAEDAADCEALRSSPKNRAENLMIVDLMRNDLGIVCEAGSVEVPKLMEVESYATVHQLVSTVRGRLRTDVDAVECLRQAFPAGSMTGAPKRRTLEILDRLEPEPRGVYAGSIGYISACGAADLNVVIRTAVVTPGHVRVGAGGALVAQSDPAAEVAEVALKADVILRAVAAVAIQTVAAAGDNGRKRT